MKISEGPLKIYTFEGKPGFHIRGKLLTDLAIVPQYDDWSKNDARLFSMSHEMYKYIQAQASKGDSDAQAILREIEE